MELSQVSKELAASWWVFAFAISCFAIYEQASCRLAKGIEKLSVRACDLENAIHKLEQSGSELRLQVLSQNDPNSIELSLISGLGLVPEGYTKIYYTSE